MKVNIYYGGRGLIDDPTIYVMNKITQVLDELHVNVTRYNLYEDKSGITTLPKTLKEADAIVLAASVEWMGIGGLLTQFLDACWLYADKHKIQNLYMMPIVLATTYGERDALYTLMTAWETLGGISNEGLCAYVEDHLAFETNSDYSIMIERKTEQFYRMISKKAVAFPNSNDEVNKRLLRTKTLELTPQESEELSMYVSNENYVKKQKEDIEELTNIFKGMLGDVVSDEKYISELKKGFRPLDGFKVIFKIDISDINKSLIIDIDNSQLNCYYGSVQNPDLNAKTSKDIIEQIVAGEKTFQSAFMTGELTAQGNFKILRSLDSVFRF